MSNRTEKPTGRVVSDEQMIMVTMPSVEVMSPELALRSGMGFADVLALAARRACLGLND